MRHLAFAARIGAAIGIATATLAGCSSGAEGGPGAPADDATSRATASRGESSTTPRSPAAASTAPSPAPPDAPAEVREAAALKALRGEASPSRAPVEATDDGAPLDPTLRDRIAPRARPPLVKVGPAATVNGRLPPEVVQRIVRQSFGRFRLCYEGALKQDPELAGTVEVHFTIDQKGATTGVVEGRSTIDDPTMRSCVVRAFAGLTFPQPEGGVVAVSYPILFSPPIE